MANPLTDTSFFGHPRGLSVLFFTEMWERFSYYGMRALLLLYMTAPLASGGLGFDAAQGGAIYGLYTSMAYMAALPGGWIADRLIGQRQAVLYGGIIIASGHFSMAIPSLVTFYLGLVLIVIGTGLLKGNVSVIVGQLYTAEDERRDAGFSIFYMGINLGAFLAPLVCGYLGQRVSWHTGFAAAGVGMAVGVVQYLLGSRSLGVAGLHPVPAASPAAGAALRSKAMLWGGLFVVVLAVIGIGGATGTLPVTPVGVADAAGVVLLLSTVVFFAWLLTSREWTRLERKRLVILTYLLHTIGELCLSPVGLSAMTRLAPARIAGLVMGVWFLGTSVGNFIGGRVGGLYESMALPTLFGTVGGFAIAAGLVLLVFVGPMRRMIESEPAESR